MIEFDSVDLFYLYIKDWLPRNEGARYLNGYAEKTGYPQMIVRVWVHHVGAWFEIREVSTVEAAQRFVKLYEAKMRDEMLFKRGRDDNKLILATDDKPNGWYFYKRLGFRMPPAWVIDAD